MRAITAILISILYLITDYFVQITITLFQLLQCLHFAMKIFLKCTFFLLPSKTNADDVADADDDVDDDDTDCFRVVFKHL